MKSIYYLRVFLEVSRPVHISRVKKPNARSSLNQVDKPVPGVLLPIDTTHASHTLSPSQSCGNRKALPWEKSPNKQKRLHAACVSSFVSLPIPGFPPPRPRPPAARIQPPYMITHFPQHPLDLSWSPISSLCVGPFMPDGAPEPYADISLLYRRISRTIS